MSSIFGLVNFNKKPVTVDQLLPIQTVLDHWQADDRGIRVDKIVGLGHLMLHNTPESLNEKLPLYRSESKLAITADARLDNRDELFSKLGLSQMRKDSIPDSSLILSAYQKYGDNCVTHLTGDFAFAIWDGREQKLFCARDQMGVRPFFYYYNNEFFAFATEKKGILVLPDVDKAVNRQFFYNQLIRPAEQAADTTIYQQLKRLAPAQTVTVDAANAAIRLRKYWTLDAGTELRFKRKEDYYDGLLHHFTEAVKCRTRSRFDVGVQLSGGIDSSSITGIAASLMHAEGKQLATLSNTLPDGVTDDKKTSLDERRYIDEVIRFNAIDKPIYITQRAFDSQLEELDFSLLVDDGLERWVSLWLVPLKKAALQHNIRTLLSGFPGDELVTYRGKYYFLDYLDKHQYFRYVLAKKRYPGFHKIEPLLPYWLSRGIHELKMTLHLYGIDVRSALAMFNIPDKHLKCRTAGRWHDANYKEKFKSYRHFQRCRLLRAHTGQRMESESRYGLYFRTEPRFPMADIRLTQYYLSIPNELKYEGTLTRSAFRRAVKAYLPPSILERDSKQGSIAPFFLLQMPDFPGIRAIVDGIPKHPAIRKSAILERIDTFQQQLGTDTVPAAYRDRAMSKMPSLELLRWLEKNLPDTTKTLVKDVSSK